MHVCNMVYMSSMSMTALTIGDGFVSKNKI